ncbi:MAG: hypothetical protein HY548_01420, partial [Elusimicrobia bacterium]|nr:hypothetical protein [Elusimicrobiota bacterium]
EAINLALASGVGLGITSVELIRGTPSDPGIINTEGLVTWTKDGRILIHEDVIQQWLMEGQDIVQALYKTILHENYEFNGYTAAIQAGEPASWDLLKRLHNEAVELGYTVPGAEANWGATGAIGASSEFGSTDFTNLISQLGSPLFTQLMQSVSGTGQPAAPANSENLSINLGGTTVNELSLLGLDPWGSQVNTGFTPPGTLRTPPGTDFPEFQMYDFTDANGVVHTWIVYRENTAEEGQPETWQTTTFVHIAKDASGEMIYRTTYNLGSQDNPDTSITIEVKGGPHCPISSDPTFYAKLTVYTHYETEDADNNPDTPPTPVMYDHDDNPGTPDIQLVSYGKTMMAKVGNGADRLVSQQSWYDGWRVQSNNDGNKVYNHVTTLSSMDRVGNQQVTKNSITTNLSQDPPRVTYASLIKIFDPQNPTDPSKGTLFGVVSGEINMSNDPDHPDYVNNSLRIIDNEGRFDYHFEGGAWVWAGEGNDPGRYNVNGDKNIFSIVAGAGIDNNGDGDSDDPGVDANGDGDYADPGDTPPDVPPATGTSLDVSRTDGFSVTGTSVAGPINWGDFFGSSSLFGSLNMGNLLNAAASALRAQGQDLGRELRQAMGLGGGAASASPATRPTIAPPSVEKPATVAVPVEKAPVERIPESNIKLTGGSAEKPQTGASFSGKSQTVEEAFASRVTNPAAVGLTNEALLEILGVDGTVTTVEASGEGSYTFFAEALDGLDISGTLKPEIKEKLLRSLSITVDGRYPETGAISHSEMNVVYEYDDKGRLLSARGWGTTVSVDEFGNTTTSRVTQVFVVINGQAKLKEAVTESHTVNVDGSESWSDGTNGSEAMRVEYFYNLETGNLLEGAEAAAKGTVLTMSQDAFG